ncbi:Gfo/Idh/MocA family protein [Petrimonas mucosa]|jgi:predicted dehydrogenase|uniref:Putative oxidoreductase y4hM n=1 Tax=Petrimonas mucosa TaxID=1642646 RepID=A0A1G4G3X1_9BACT|nr:Gfo/Idh/MocA family oxidoreductase [Petrimonas mucosa]SCM55444.1 putative oxidoreductase y4hM [Petrimonas mucosa]SFU70167.1 Predicted dehydrogenase [Porphyromonadaceae bacterium KHP3R9]
MKQRKLKMGMIGGGSDAFIGAIHRRAAFMDNYIELVCGCFSVNPEISRSSGREYFLPDNRIYNSYHEMFEKEMQLPVDERMDFVTIVTPNKWHFEPAMMALERGFHVVIDKPMTFSLEEALKLKEKVEETGLVLALTHVYSGYPAIKEARARIANGELGRLRKVYVEYTQGWLSQRIELQGGNNAGWRTNPETTGKAGCMGDIGTHAWHLAEYVTGLKVQEVCADLQTYVEGRLVDDDGASLLRMEKGVTGVLMATQIATGEANNIRLRIYGDKGGLEWRQMDSNRLILRWGDKPSEELYMGNNEFLSDLAKWNTRTPAGHPEGFIEAFANIYRNFALTVMAKENGEEPDELISDFPTVYDGVRGMQFVEMMVQSAKDEETKWKRWIN